MRMVLAQRQLFQCPACWVDLGGSPTARDVYRVWLKDCLMVIASNKWAAQLQELEVADSARIQLNEVLDRFMCV